MSVFWAGLSSVASSVALCHTGHQWAEQLFATGKTGSSTAQPKGGPLPSKTVGCCNLCFYIICIIGSLIELIPNHSRVPEGERARSSLKSKQG